MQGKQGPAEESLEEMGEPDGTAGTVGTSPTDSQDEVTIHVMEEEIKDRLNVGAEDRIFQM